MATGNSSAFVPRKDSPELGSLSVKASAPSVSIANFSRGINVVPQQQVQFGAPYVATQQTANFLTSLGQFNSSLSRFGTAYSEYDTAQNKLQGEADAMTMDPAERARLFNEFKGNVDKAVESGLLPKSMHPVYRMTFVETATKNQVAEELPNLLEQERNKLTDAGATNIGPQLARMSSDYINGKFTDPLSKIAASKAAQGIVLNTQNQFEAQRNAKFDFQLEQDKDTELQNTLIQLKSTFNGGDENLRSSLYDELGKKLVGDKDPNGRIGKALKSFATAQLEAGENPAMVSKMLQEASLNIKTKNGLWSETGVGRAYMADISDDMLTNIKKREELYRTRRNDDLKMMETEAEADINMAIREGKITTKADRDFLAEKIAQKYPTISKSVITLKVDNADYSVNNAAAAAKANPELASKIDRQIASNPEEALYTIASLRERKAIPPLMADELEKKAREANDEVSLATGADAYKKLDKLISENITTMFNTKSPLSSFSDAENPKDIAKRVELQDSVRSFGQAAIRASVRKVMDEDAAGPQLRQSSPAAFKVKLDQAVEEAMKRTNDFGLKRGQNLDKAVLTESEELGPKWTAPMLMVGEMVKDVNTKNPADLTFEDKLSLQRVNDLKRDILNDVRYGVSAKEKAQASNAYAILTGYTGYSPDSIINGKDENGVPINKKMIDPKNGLFFQNESQYNDVLKEFNAAKSAGSDLKQTKLYKLFNALGVPAEEQQTFIKAQQFYVLKRRIPSFSEIISDPSYPKGTKVDAGITPSLGNPYPQEAVPSINAEMTSRMVSSYESRLAEVNSRIAAIKRNKKADKGLAKELETLNTQKTQLETALKSYKK